MVEILYLGLSALWQASTLELLYLGIAIVGCLALISYPAWLLVERLGAKDRPPKGYLQWLKQLFEGIMGL